MRWQASDLGLFNCVITTMASLEGKVIAVTGGAYGIGFAVAELLAKRGATIALADVVEDKLTQACDHVKALGVQATAHRVDVQDSQQVEAWMKATNTAFGRLDGAANMAGVSGGKQRPRGIIDQDQNGWDVCASSLHHI
jgi:NAD(P)-dependent dehydrogenase (short-subunit alcohol dehydrogenase family)